MGNETFGALLKEILKKMNISQENAALKIGLSKGSMSQIINGPKNSTKKNTQPSYELLRRLCWILNFDPTDREALFYKLYTEYNILPDSISKDSAYGQVILHVMKDNLLRGNNFYKDDQFNTRKLLERLKTELEHRANNSYKHTEQQQEFYQQLQESDAKLNKCKIIPPGNGRPFTTIGILE